MTDRHGSCMTCLLTWVAVTLLAVHSVWSTSHHSTLNLEVTYSSKLHQSSGAATSLKWSGAVNRQMSPLSFLWRRRRPLPHELRVFNQDPSRTEVDSPFVILLVRQRRMDGEPVGWDHPHDKLTVASLTRPQGYRCKEVSDAIACLYQNFQALLSDPNYEKHGFLADTHGEGLMPTATSAKLMFEKKKQKKTEEIRRALNRRYKMDTVSSRDASEVSLFNERQILDELLTLKNMLRKKQGHGVPAQWLNGIPGSSEVDNHFWKSGKSFPGYLTGGKDLIIDSPRVDKQHTPRDGSQVLDGQVLDGQVIDGQVLDGQVLDNHALNLPNLYPLAYSADNKLSDSKLSDSKLSDSKLSDSMLSDSKLSASSESFPVPMDGGQAADLQPLTQPADAAGLLPSPDLQYSTFNDDLEPTKIVSTQKNDDHVTSHRMGGHFLEDTTDCHVISTKSCLSDLHCSCSGFYVCAEGRCARLTDDGNAANKDAWMEVPTDQAWMEVPTDQDGWMEVPTDQDGWMEVPTDQDAWINDPTNKVGWMDGPTDQRGLLMDPVAFRLVEGADYNGGTEKQIWHNEPFDFSKTATAAAPGQPTDARFWPVNQGLMEPQLDNLGAGPELEQPLDDGFWVQGSGGLDYLIQGPGRRSGDTQLGGQVESVKE